MRDLGRRAFLTNAYTAGVGAAVTSSVYLGQAVTTAATARPLPPTEDLMREHGLVHRLMGIFEECADRLAAGGQLPPGAITNTGVLVDEFVEAYHEELEERHVFPVFARAGRMQELVAVLRNQHVVGRRLAERAIFLGGRTPVEDEGQRAELARVCATYARMYRAHAAHEDTRLFAVLREALSPADFEALGERFEQIEHATLGEGGFAGMVERVAGVEESLGLSDLGAFTPSL
jgi:hemerythrin-like domain-containing protein